jgi:hypothetical protein
MHQNTPLPPRRRQSDTDPLGTQDIEDRLVLGSRRMDTIEESVRDIRADVSEVLDIVRLGKSFFRVAGHFGAFLKWTTAIAAPLVAMWFAFKGGKS